MAQAVCGIACVFSLLQAAENSYVRPATCAECHPKISRTYLETGMGRSFSKIGEGQSEEDWDQNNTFYHPASDRYYTVARRGGKFFLRRHQLGYRGAVTNVVEKQIHYVIGSGNHARSFVHRTDDGRLLELPLGWYAAKGGYWAMSPGYDQPKHSGFRREISTECLFCHNAYAEVVEKGTPQGIDCQRCHGPGRDHVRAVRSDAQGEEVHRSILNPARLNPRQQTEVCLQCHLEATSRPLPHSLRRAGREPFSYRPGEPLRDYMIHFDHRRGVPHQDKYVLW